MSLSQQFAPLVRLINRTTLLIGLIFFGLMVEIILYLVYGKEWFLRPAGIRAITSWMKRLTQIIGLRVITNSPPATHPPVLVANHISWIDIVAIASYCPTLFLSKNNVKNWPLIGTLAHLSGTLFIQRNSVSALQKTLSDINKMLHKSRCVTFFPEGTTTNGKGVERFKPALFEAAVKYGNAVQPIAIQYRRDGTIDELAPFIDDDTFIAHLVRIMSVKYTTVEIHFLSEISGKNRHDLSNKCLSAIRKHLNLSSTINYHRISQCYD